MHIESATNLILAWSGQARLILQEEDFRGQKRINTVCRIRLIEAIRQPCHVIFSLQTRDVAELVGCAPPSGQKLVIAEKFSVDAGRRL